MKRVLVVEDEELLRNEVCKLLVREGWDVARAGSVREAEAALAARPFDVLLVDVILPDADGTALIPQRGKARVVMMSAYATIDSAVRAMRLGAVDYVTKPFHHDDLRARLARAAPPSPAASAKGIVGESPALRAVLDEVLRVAAKTNLTILILGETGTGKELVARKVHDESPRCQGPFMDVNCGAFAESLITSQLFGHVRGAFTGATEDRAGLFESAKGGTVFLDEVADLPPLGQDGLLRVLDQRKVNRVGSNSPRPVDVRVVAATNKDLWAMEKQKTFRADLIYRLEDYVVRLPPLRDRGEDLFLIADHLIQSACAEYERPLLSLSEPARRVMRERRWPGNVRELTQTLRRAVALCDGDQIDALLVRERSPRDGGEDDEDPSIDAHVKRYVLRNQDRLTRPEIAHRLGISAPTLWRWCKRLRITPPSIPPGSR